MCVWEIKSFYSLAFCYSVWVVLSVKKYTFSKYDFVAG